MPASLASSWLPHRSSQVPGRRIPIRSHKRLACWPKGVVNTDLAETYRRILNASATATEAPKSRAKWPGRAAFIVATLGVGSWLWRRSPGARRSTGSQG